MIFNGFHLLQLLPSGISYKGFLVMKIIRRHLFVLSVWAQIGVVVIVGTFI